MRKTVFKITSIFILISILNGCSSLLKYETSKENISETSIEIQKWIRETSLKPENGNIHICRVKASEGDMYYLYFNGSKLVNNSYTSYGSVGISPIKKKDYG